MSVDDSVVVDYHLRERVPGSNKHRVPDPDSPDNRELYLRLELMAFILEEVTYNELYGDGTALTIAELIDKHFRPRTDTGKRGPRRFFDTRIGSGGTSERRQIAHKLEEIRDKVTNPDGTDKDLTFRHLLLTNEHDPECPEDIRALKVLFKEMQTLKRSRGTFCFPFAYMHMDAGELQTILNRIGTVTLFHLLSNSAIDLVKEQGAEFVDVIKKARKLGFFSSRPDIVIEGGEDPEANNYLCNNNNCDPYTGGFCSTAEDDNCSALGG